MNAVVTEFWQQSEKDFYDLLKRLSDLPGEAAPRPTGNLCFLGADNPKSCT